jgi:hypothetical protein
MAERQKWWEREIAATWFKPPSCVTVRGWVFRREQGDGMSYAEPKREQSIDVMSVSAKGEFYSLFILVIRFEYPLLYSRN